MAKRDSRGIIVTRAPGMLDIDAQIEAALRRGLACAARALESAECQQWEERKQERALRRRSFAIWEDGATAAIPGSNATDPALAANQGEHTESSSSPASSPLSIDEPTPVMLAPWYARDDDPGSVLGPDFDDACESGETWRRLGSDAAYVANNDDIRVMLRTRTRLCRRYRLNSSDRDAVGRVERMPFSGGGRKPSALRTTDLAHLIRALQRTAATDYRDLFANPIWRAWRSAPGDDADVDPDEPRVMAAFFGQRRRFREVRAELLEHGCTFASAIQHEVARHFRGTARMPRRRVRLIRALWEQIRGTVREKQREAAKRKALRLQQWDTAWTRSMR